MTRPPKNIIVEASRHGRRRVYYRVGKGPRVRLPDDMDSAAFADAYRRVSEGYAGPLDVRAMPVTPIQRRKQATEKTLRGNLRSCRTRARRRGLAFDLDLDFLLGMAEEQQFRCALTGIEFFAESPAKSRVHPYTPSVDRIVPALGYVRGNVRIVAYAVNAMLLDWGEAMFHQIANSYRYWRTKEARANPLPDGVAPYLEKSTKDNNDL